MKVEKLFECINGIDEEMVEAAWEDGNDPMVFYYKRPRFAAVRYLAAAFGIAAVLVVGILAVTFGRGGDDIVVSPLSTVQPPNEAAEADFMIYGVDARLWIYPDSYDVTLDRIDDVLPESIEALEISHKQTVSLTAAVGAVWLEKEACPLEQMPVRIFLMADGRLLEFGVDGGEPSVYNDVYAKFSAPSENAYSNRTAYKITFEADETMEKLVFIPVYFPERIPKTEENFYFYHLNHCFETTLINTLAVSDGENGVSDGFGAYYRSIYQKNNEAFAFYTVSVKDGRGIRRAFNGIELSDENDKIYLQFRKDIDCDRYLFILCDGKPLDMFDGEYTCKINTKGEQRAFELVIPEEYIPESGEHVFEAFAVSAEANGQHVVIRGDKAYHDVEATGMVKTTVDRSE